MAATARKLLTAEEFLLLPDNGKRLSLVRGEVTEAMPTNLEHGMIAVRLASRLERWAAETNAGRVGVESGFILERDPDTVRGPDVYFIRAERLPAAEHLQSFADFPPDLAVEVVSPSETANEIREKVQDYLAAGTPLMLVIYPRTRELVAHTPDGLARTYRAGEDFTAPDVLPGFSCRVAELFM